MNNKFTVTKPWEHNGHAYTVGEVVDLSASKSGLLPEQVESLVRNGTLLPVEPIPAVAGKSA